MPAYEIWRVAEIVGQIVLIPNLTSREKKKKKKLCCEFRIDIGF